MALQKSAAMSIFLLVALSSLGVDLIAGETYTVGDSAGWIVPRGKLNYTEWASTKRFQLGDTLVFVYNKEWHNVLEVVRKDYESCSSQSPVMAYNTGNDSITIKKPGGHFFICGVPGHCQLGQKLGISIATPDQGSSPPTPSPSSPAPSNSSAPGPQGNHAPATHTGLGLALALCAIAAVSGLILPYYSS